MYVQWPTPSENNESELNYPVNFVKIGKKTILYNLGLTLWRHTYGLMRIEEFDWSTELASWITELQTITE